MKKKVNIWDVSFRIVDEHKFGEWNKEEIENELIELFPQVENLIVKRGKDDGI